MKTNHEKYDIIGDIHGHADTLRALLGKLGYTERGGVYEHPERRVVFVGDFIDRGPKIRETLQIVRGMTDAGNALAVLGNHEWNALRFHTAGSDGLPLRPHTPKNIAQHRATTDQFAGPLAGEWREWLDWFRNVPLCLDLGGIRVIHAAWCADSVAKIGGRLFADDTFFRESGAEGTSLHAAVSTLLAGPEALLPEGVEFIDKEGHAHEDIRARWFSPEHREGVTYRELVFPPSAEPPQVAVPAEILEKVPYYGENEPVVAFGHYWLPPGQPVPQAKNAVCVDYSVAGRLGGNLVAYRWDGEADVESGKFAWVERRAP